MDDDTKRRDIARRLRILAEELEAMDEPARPYAHRCQGCGCPIYVAGLCTDCLEGDGDAVPD